MATEKIVRSEAVSDGELQLLFSAYPKARDFNAYRWSKQSYQFDDDCGGGTGVKYVGRDEEGLCLTVFV